MTSSDLLAFCFLQLSIFLSWFLGSHQACDKIDRESLITFSQSLTAPMALNWTTISSNCCDWEGIACDQKGRVTHLSLPSRGLSGSLSPSLVNLTRLSHLNLARNSLTGSLPNGLFSSMNLLKVLDLSYNRFVGDLLPSPSFPPNLSLPSCFQTIDLSSNRFHGKFPSSIFRNARNLVYLNISINKFSGPVPSSICSNSNSVRILDFTSNLFSGQIPRGLGECSKLEVLNAGFNALSGDLPEEIYQMLSLQEISLPSNKLTGVISNSVVALMNLTMLELYSNGLNGTLPREIGNLSKLERLELQMNGLNGTLPPSLMNCTKLQKLKLLSNSLEGDISNLDFSKLLELQTLDLGSNHFTGEIPKSLYSCKSLQAMRFSQNKLQGQITADILALRSLTFLTLSFNNFTNISGALEILKRMENLTVLMISGAFMDEALPNVIDPVGFKNLQFLSVGRCRLKGQVPSWIAKLHRLRILDLAENKLTGTIPDWLGTLPDLFYINLHGNQLTGEFRRALTGLPALQSNELTPKPDEIYLDLPLILKSNPPKPGDVPTRTYNKISNIQPMIDLHNNSLSGTIPEETGKLRGLHQLDLSRNEFYGEIPGGISELSNLERLDLSHNRLSGTIPESLGRLNFLSELNVSFNDLRGGVPASTQLQGLDASAFEGNAGLCGVPTNRKCGGGGNGDGGNGGGEEGVFDGVGVYCAIAGAGFMVGFWGVCGSLWVKKSWRDRYFGFVFLVVWGASTTTAHPRTTKKPVCDVHVTAAI